MTRDTKRRLLYAGMFVAAAAVAMALHFKGIRGTFISATMYMGVAAMLMGWPLIWGRGAKLTAKEPRHPVMAIILVGLGIILAGTGVVAFAALPGQSHLLNALMLLVWGIGSVAYLLFRRKPDPAAQTDEREMMIRGRSDRIGADASFWLVVAICAGAALVATLAQDPDFVVEAKWLPAALLGLLGFRIAVMAIAMKVIRRREGAHGRE